jgi:hypothetical protein
MSSSLLKDPEQHDAVDVTVDTDPYAGSLLGAYTAERRALILASLPDDLDDDAKIVTNDAGSGATALGTVDFGLHTYSPDMRAEIVDSLHDEDDGARFPNLPTPEEFAAVRKGDLAKAVQYIQSTGRYRSMRESA